MQFSACSQRLEIECDPCKNTMAKWACGYSKPSNMHHCAKKKGAGRTLWICCDHFPILWGGFCFFSPALHPDLQKCFGLGRKFTRQSVDLKFFPVISPNVGSAVQDTAVPVPCFQLIRKWKTFYNPDLDSSCIMCLIFAALSYQRPWPGHSHFL